MRARALRRGVAVLGLVCGGLFSVGTVGASAQTAPCILVLCTPVPLPTVTPIPLPTLTPLPTVALPTLTPLPTLTTALPTLTDPLSSPTLPLATPTVSLPGGGGSVTQSSPTPTGGGGLLGGLVNTQQSGQTCTVTLPGGICVLPSSSSCPVGSTDPSCIVNTGGPSGCTSGCTPGGGGNQGTGGNDGRGGGPGGGSQPQSVGTFSPFGGGSLTAGDPAGGAAAAIPLGLSVASIPPVQQLSPVSGLLFGHALILWPLFGLLDLLGLAAVYLVVRRFRATRSD